MPTFTIVAVIIVIGYALFSRFDLNSSKSGPEVENETQPNTLEGYTEISQSATTPSPVALASASPTPKPSSSSTHVSSDSKISISVDSNLDQKSSREMIIFPGAINKGGNVYETDAFGETVYDWYKQEMEKKSYQIRNNVRTRANDKFKAVLQGESGSSAFKVAIDQENSASKTQITVN